MILRADITADDAESLMTEAFGYSVGIAGDWHPPHDSWFFTDATGVAFYYRDRRDPNVCWVCMGLKDKWQGDAGVAFVRAGFDAMFASDFAEMRAYIRKDNRLCLNYCTKRLPGGAVLTEDAEAWVYAWKAERWPAK